MSETATARRPGEPDARRYRRATDVDARASANVPVFDTEELRWLVPEHGVAGEPPGFYYETCASKWNVAAEALGPTLGAVLRGLPLVATRPANGS